MVEKKDKTLTEGKAVHAVLEKEIAPVQVTVKTESREDGWALRLINVWCDVMGLLKLEPGQGGGGRGKGVSCVREVPVYGWIQGVFVMGVIDEIEKRTIEVGGAGEEAKKGSEGKTWASQEEWKKDQLRKQTTSPKKTGKANAGEVNKTAARPLTCFFGSSQPQSQTDKPARQEEGEEQKQGWAYFLSDTKTRISSWLPAEEDQFSPRLQCMTYKRLFDGLCLGALSPSSSSSNPLPPLSSCPTFSDSSSSAYKSAFDQNATPMDWTFTFASLDLDPYQPLSSVFFRDAIPLCQSWGTDLALWVAERNADVCTLDHIRLLLEAGLRELVFDARRGQLCKGKEEGVGVGVIQDTLALTYRRQSMKRSRKRKKTASISTTKPTKEGEELRQTTLSSIPTDESTVVTTTEDSSISAPAEEKRKSIDALEGHYDASVAIEHALSSPTPCTPKKPPSPTSPTSPTPPTPTQENEDRVEKTNIIGIVTFPYNPSLLDAYLEKMIAMWKGERSLVGVSVDQTRRCWTCEWIEGCEWRISRSLLYQSKAREKSMARVLIETCSNPVPKEKDEVQEERETAEVEGEDEFWSNLAESITVKDSEGNVLDW